MHPINLIVAINLFVSTSANISGAKKGIKSKMTNVIERPKTFLQKVPPNVAALVLVLTIAAIFNVGTLDDFKTEYSSLRIIGLMIFLVFSWIQVLAYKALGDFYSQDIVVFKKHILQTKGYYKIIRHPQYLSQLLSDLGVGLALFGYLIKSSKNTVFKTLPLESIKKTSLLYLLNTTIESNDINPKSSISEHLFNTGFNDISLINKPSISNILICLLEFTSPK